MPETIPTLLIVRNITIRPTSRPNNLKCHYLADSDLLESLATSKLSAWQVESFSLALRKIFISNSSGRDGSAVLPKVVSWSTSQATLIRFHVNGVNALLNNHNLIDGAGASCLSLWVSKGDGLSSRNFWKCKLLVSLLRFLEPYLRQAELTDSVRLLYRGTLRVLLVLLHDFPEFLCEFHFEICLLTFLNDWNLYSWLLLLSQVCLCAWQKLLNT